MCQIGLMDRTFCKNRWLYSGWNLEDWPRSADLVLFLLGFIFFRKLFHIANNISGYNLLSVVPAYSSQKIGSMTSRITDAQWSLFSSKSENFGHGQTNFGVFSANSSAPISVLWVPCPCPCFPLINHYFYKKLKANVSQEYRVLCHVLRQFSIVLL